MRFARSACGAALPLLLAAIPASAAPADCAALNDPKDRLACYDRQFNSPSTAQAQTAQAPQPQQAQSAAAGTHWQVAARKSPFTDLTAQVVSTVSREPAGCRWNRDEPVRMKIQCLNNATSLVLETNCFMASSSYRDYGEVLYRIDGQEPKVARMEASRDNRSLGLWGGENSIPVIREMLEGRQMTVRMKPYAEKPFSASFDIAGLEEAIKDLRAECKW